MGYIPPETVTPRSITIQPGQTIVLPKGVKIQTIVSDGDATLTSTCDLPDISPLACYGFVSIADPNNGSQTVPFQIFTGDPDGNIHYIGVRIQGVRIDFSSEISWFDNVGLKAALEGASPLIKNVYISPQLSGARGYKKYIMFKAPAAIGDAIELIAYTNLFSVAGSVPVEYNLSGQTLSAIEADGNESVPSCP